MNTRFLLILICSFISYANSASYDGCRDDINIPGIRILNPDGGMKLDGSDGVTLIVDTIGRIQMFQRASIHEEGQIFGAFHCPSDYGLIISVRDENNRVILRGLPSQNLEPVSSTSVEGSGTELDPWRTTTIIKLKTMNSFVAGDEEITIIDKAYKDITRVDRSMFAKGLNPNYTYYFSYLLNSNFTNDTSGVAFAESIIPNTSMPMTVGVKRDQAISTDGAGTMSMSYAGGDYYTSYHSGDSMSIYDATNGKDLSNLIEVGDKDNAFGFQWKVAGKESIDMIVSGPDFTGAYVESETSFNPENIFVGEESILKVEFTPVKVNIKESTFVLALPEELEYVDGSLSVTCGLVKEIKATDNGITNLEISADYRFEIAADSTCTIELAVKGRLAGETGLDNALMGDSNFNLIPNTGRITVLSRAQGTGVTSSIPSSSLFSLLTMILSLGLLVRYKPKG